MPPLPPALRSLALSDVTPDDVRWMIREGETLVELKSQIPKEGVGPSVAAFANTIGGWIVLGVDDVTRELVGWEPKGRADAVDYLRDLLRTELDPLPPFAAKSLEIDDQMVGLVRVYESSDTPHIVRGTGAVFIREPAAKAPIRDHRQLVDLARRGEAAERDARERIAKTPAIASVLRTPDSRRPKRDYDGVEFVARAATLSVPPAVRDWPLTGKAAGLCSHLAEQLLPPLDPSMAPAYGRIGPELVPFGRGIAVNVLQEKTSDSWDEALVMADSAGVVAARLRRGPIHGDRPSLPIERILDDELARWREPSSTARGSRSLRSRAHRYLLALWA